MKERNQNSHQVRASKVFYTTIDMKLNSELDCDTDGDATFKEPSQEQEWIDIEVDTEPRKAFLFGEMMGFREAVRQINGLHEYAIGHLAEYMNEQNGCAEELATFQNVVLYLDRIFDKTFTENPVPKGSSFTLQSQQWLEQIDNAMKDVDAGDWPWVDKD